LDALEEILSPEAEVSQFADLKLSAFVEHLATEALAQISPISAGDAGKLHVLNVLTALSRRQLVIDHGFVLEGLAAVTQRNATVETLRRTVQVQGGRRLWDITLARCGVVYVRQLLEVPILNGCIDDGVMRQTRLGTSMETPTYAAREAASSEVDGGAADVVVEVGAASTERLIQLEAACKLRGFKVGEVTATNAVEGPTLLTVSVELAAGESIRPIQAAAPDISRELGVLSIAVENDPKRPYHIRFLVPRPDRQYPILPRDTPTLVDVDSEHYYGLWLGAGVDGRPVKSCVSEWPHLLVAGTTGSGKTTFLKSLLYQLNEIPVGEVSLVVVDGKGEYDYVDLFHKQHFPAEFNDVLLGYEHATEVLKWLVEEEVVRRRSVLRKYFAENPTAPRAPRQAFVQARSAGRPFPTAPVVVVIDEFAEIMLASGPTARSFEELVQRVVQAGRSALVHLILATQRPDANVLPGAIKANMPSRIALSLPSHHDSMTVLNSTGAELLLGTGDLLFQTSGGERLRLQGYGVPG
jgi:energy-coupling factor transporter ATP-binding protein EcfA2